MLAAHGLTRAEADRSAWVIERGGRRLEGAAALSRVLEELDALELKPEAKVKILRENAARLLKLQL
jgi:hypothetical protein